MRRGALLIGLAAIVGLGLRAAVRGEERAPSAVRRAIARGREGVVRLQVQGGRPLGDAARERLFRDVESRDAGAGVIVGERQVLTHAALCAYEGASFALTLPSGQRVPAALRRRDPGLGLALLEAEAPLGVAPLELAASREVPLGALVIALGDPFGAARDAQAAASLGVLEGRLVLDARGSGYGGRVLVTDAALNPGSEGGPLLDLQGRVLGILAPLLRDERTGSLVGHAIPSEAARELLTRAEAPKLGFQAAAEPLGLRVAAVEPGGAAAAAGLEVGDLIVEVGGAPASAAGLRAAIGAGPVVVTVERDGARRELRLGGPR